MPGTDEKASTHYNHADGQRPLSLVGKSKRASPGP